MLLAWAEEKEACDESNDIVKVDGQKADDATIPVHLWGFTFRTDRETDTSIRTPLVSDWRKGLLALFRDRMLRRWRRKQLRSWQKFSGEVMNPSYGSRAEGVSYRTKTIPSRPIRRGSEQDECVKQEIDREYKWTPQGRQKYQHWHKHWRERKKLLQHCMTSAVDCIFRAAECSWWEWPAGSTLFFWKWPRSHRVWARDGQPHFEVGQLPEFKRPQRPPIDEEGRRKMKTKLDKVGVDII